MPPRADPAERICIEGFWMPSNQSAATSIFSKACHAGSWSSESAPCQRRSSRASRRWLPARRCWSAFTIPVGTTGPISSTVGTCCAAGRASASNCLLRGWTIPTRACCTTPPTRFWLPGVARDATCTHCWMSTTNRSATGTGSIASTCSRPTRPKPKRRRCWSRFSRAFSTWPRRPRARKSAAQPATGSRDPSRPATGGTAGRR